MWESRFEEKVLRPASCPYCKGRGVDTLAKIVTAQTLWRCRVCDRTWTIESLNTPRAPRP